MDTKVVKRDGRVVGFNRHKIGNAISKAFEDTYFELIEDDIADIDILTDEVIENIEKLDLEFIRIESVQDVVVDTLLNSDVKFHDVAIKYVTYRTKKALKRVEASNMEEQLMKLIRRDESVIHENANKDSNVYNTQRDLTAGIPAKVIGLKMLSEKVRSAHLNGDIHFHDLDYSPYSTMTNCSLPDFKSMFKNGFKIGNAEVESPKSIQTACAQLAQIITNVASLQYGGTSVDMVDQLLSPFAEMNYQKHLKDVREHNIQNGDTYALNKTIKDIYDGIQGLEYEINTMYTSNGQTPFVTLGYGLGTSLWEREIQKAIMNVRIKGLGKERRTAIFPKLVFFLEDGINLKETDPNYDIKQLAIKCATERMYPDVISAKRLRELTGGGVRTPMGCRSFLQTWLDKNGEEVNSGRMNLGVVTLNLPRIAIEAEGDQDTFWEILEERIEIAREALVFRVERAKESKPKNAPILYMHGAWGRLESGESVDDLFKDKRATISLGYIGLYEVGTLFYGPDWESNPKAKEFTLRVLKELKRNADDWGNQYGYHFSVYSTPSESLTDRFCKMDKEKFGSIPDITEKDYYNNSFHLDVRKKWTPFEKLEFEKDYAEFTSGGFIHYAEYPNLKQNPKALEAVWDFAYDKIGYLGTNTPIDHCFACGFTGDFNPTENGFECPECKNDNPETCDVVKRTCGYLGNPQKRPMAYGRHKEISARVKHMKPVTLRDELL